MSASRNRRGVVLLLLFGLGRQQAGADELTPESPASGSDAVGLQEVIVTSQRREQSVMSVPLAVSAVTSQELQNQGITQAASLSSVVPDLQVNSGFGDAQPNFSLRGISVGNEYNTNQASPVGVYLDDEYLPFRSTHAMQLYDLDRIEVVKGPQGTLFGRNTTGGAINFITRQPGLSGSNGFADVSYGRFNEIHAQGAAESTPVEGVFGIRAAVNYKNAGGFIENVYPGAADGNSEDSLSGRINFRFKPMEALDMDLKLYGSIANPTQAQVYQRGTGADLTNPLTGYSRAGLGFWQVDSVRSDHSRTNQNSGVFTLHYTLAPEWGLTSLSSYGRASLTFGQEGSGGPLSLLDTRYHSDFWWLNQEVRLTYSGERLNLQSGVYYGQDHNDTHNTYGFFFFTGPATAQSIVQDYIQTRRSTALFTQADYQITDHLTATLGGRYTWDNSGYLDGRAYVGDINYQPVVYTVGSADTALPDKHDSEGAESYRFALSYKTDAGVLVYASVNHGYRAGTYSGQGYFSPDQIYLVKPEKVNAYEIGSKGRFFENRLQVTAAAFYYKYKDQQINEVVGAVGFLRNAGRSTIKGLESELTADIAERVTARVGLAYLNAKYDSLTLSGTDLDGNDLPFAPRFTANAGFDWKLGTLAKGNLTLSPNLSYTSKQYFSPFNDAAGNQYLNQGALTLLTANLVWDWDRFSVRAWGTNLMNRRNFTYGLNLQQSFGYDYLLPGPPRMYGVALRYNF